MFVKFSWLQGIRRESPWSYKIKKKELKIILYKNFYEQLLNNRVLKERQVEKADLCRSLVYVCMLKHVSLSSLILSNMILFLIMT